MRILSLDLSTNVGAAAVVDDFEIVATVELHLAKAPLRHCSRLINTILDLAELNLNQISGLSVVVGPGSWTGLRVAVCTANAFALVHDWPVVPVTLFEVLQRQAAVLDEAGEVVGVIQLSHNRVCTKLLTPKTDADHSALDVSLTDISDLPRMLTERTAILAVNGTQLEALQARRHASATLVPSRSLGQPSVFAAQIAREKLSLVGSDYAKPVTPLYIGSPVRLDDLAHNS